MSTETLTRINLCDRLDGNKPDKQLFGHLYSSHPSRSKSEAVDKRLRIPVIAAAAQSLTAPTHLINHETMFWRNDYCLINACN